MSARRAGARSAAGRVGAGLLAAGALLAAGLSAGPSQAATGPATPTPPPTPTPAPTPNGPGVFHVWSCRTASGAPAPTDGWAVTADSGTAGALRMCGAGGALGVTATATGIGRTTMEWKPAAGLTALSARIWRSAVLNTNKTVNEGGGGTAHLTTYLGVAGTGSGIASLPSGQPVVFDEPSGFDAYRKAIGTPLAPTGDFNARTFDPLPQSNLQQTIAPIVIEAACYGQPLTSECEANYSVWRADFRLLDPAPPTSTALGGALARALQAPSRPTVSGPLDLTLDAADAGAGLLRGSIAVDGAAVATLAPPLLPATCAPTTHDDGRPAYTVQQPCPSTGRFTGALDTTALADGEHAVQVRIEDAAGNVSVVASGSLLVRNAGSIGPGSPLELRGAANGSPATDAGVLSVYWPSTARKASTKAAVVRRCTQASFAAKHPVQCKGRPAETSLTRAWSTAKLTGAVRLTDGAGAPISGAVVQLAQTPQASGASPVGLGSVSTGPDGTAGFSIDVAAGSRTIEARWSARANDTRPAATGTATITVAASSSLHAPARVGRGARIRFSGQLDGRSGSLARVPVALQVQSGGTWKTFATASTDGDGSWSTRLRFARTPGTYRVRARVGTSTTYPYAAGQASASVRVRVR